MAMKPAWLEALLSETFFVTCQVHQNEDKNKKNILCLICCQSFCPHCLPSHHSHPLLQVRRYVYQDVIRLEDLKKLIACSYIQPYTINSAKAIFLKQREQNRSSYKGPGNNSCFTCERIVQEPFHFCSLSCKVDHMVYQAQDISTINRFDESDFHFSQFRGIQNDQTTPNTSNEDPSHEFQASSCSSHDRGNSEYSNQIMLSLHNRRKGAPRRSPLV
ncbi:PLATZ transcription factor family protein [Heracleum sosnowskyi]|uniref:PLATZ transcription factor family protein n=1 Tax=Heracleum sosnowskyi TaxID=360622 RepID=A0AAD8MTP0_9APIA|nr:PLATZ transcription factor family protein [Heracleum sosnowskyi]